MKDASSGIHPMRFSGGQLVEFIVDQILQVFIVTSELSNHNGEQNVT